MASANAAVLPPPFALQPVAGCALGTRCTAQATMLSAAAASGSGGPEPAAKLRSADAWQSPASGKGDAALLLAAGTSNQGGFQPWEVHRPQAAVKELARRGELRGRVLDVGAGIGDNALFIARYCRSEVVAIDKAPRCLAFGRLKACIRGMQGAVQWVEGDVLDAASLPAASSPGTPVGAASFDTALDCGTLLCFAAEQRAAYVAALRLLLRPGGRLHIVATAEHEARVAPEETISQDELQRLFCGGAEGGDGKGGFQMVSIERVIFENHPASSQLRSYLATFRRL